MPTPKVKDSNRRGCAKACENCKRRKERCDRVRPCRRCIARRVETQCRSSPSPTSSTVPPEQVSHISSQPEPSYLCAPAPTSRDASQYDSASSKDWCDEPHEPAHIVTASDIAASVYPHHLHSLVRDGKDFPFFGNTANLSLLQQVHQLIETSLGSSSISEQHLRHQLVEPCGQRTSVSKLAGECCLPDKPTLSDSLHLVQWCLRATNSVLGVFSETDLLLDMFQWLQNPSKTPSVSDPVYYLILAIGAQSCPEDRDELAETYFEYGHNLTTTFFIDNPSTIAVQCYILATLYLLGASRRNAAFMVLGNAVRASYALGIHEQKTDSSDPDESRNRERLWAAVRKADVFTSVSLGRPLATRECRDTTADENYSPSNDMCSIFEMILAEVYTKSQVAADVVQQVTYRHRQWASRLNSRPPEDFDTYGTCEPNITLINLKESYYWNVMLLARPFLLQAVFSQVARGRLSEMRGDINTVIAPPSSSPECVLAYACVDSAVRNLDMLEGLLSTPYLPKRLPFTINSVFGSVMTLSIAQFADFDLVFPLGKSLDIAQRLLSKFRAHDVVANNYLFIADYLHDICDEYVERRVRREMERQNTLVRSLIGLIHETRRPDISKQKNVEDVEDSMGPVSNPIGPAFIMDESNPFDVHLLSGTQTSITDSLDRFGEFMLPDLSSPIMWS
ncbi:hypothetical protein BJX96DRAFT_147379 [Aspergillus floccosus]